MQKSSEISGNSSENASREGFGNRSNNSAAECWQYNFGVGGGNKSFPVVDDDTGDFLKRALLLCSVTSIFFFPFWLMSPSLILRTF